MLQLPLPSRIEYICIHGGKPETPAWAARAGWRYGYQYGSTPYGDAYMIDYVGDGSDWNSYLQHLADVRPYQSVVADFRQVDEWRDVVARMCDVAALGVRPVVVAKHTGALRLIPETVLGLRSIIGISVPTGRDYMNDGDGTLPTITEFKRYSQNVRDIHLLGGQPDQWQYLKLYYRKAANLLSIDGNSMYEQAREYGKFWSRAGWWHEMRGRGYSTGALFVCSMRNARRYLRNDHYRLSSRIAKCKHQLGITPQQISLAI